MLGAFTSTHVLTHIKIASPRGGWPCYFTPFKAIRTSDQIWCVNHQLTSGPATTSPSPSLPHDWHSRHPCPLHRNSTNSLTHSYFSPPPLNGHTFFTSVPKLPHMPPLTPSKCRCYILNVAGVRLRTTLSRECLGWGWMSLLGHNMHQEAHLRIPRKYVYIRRLCTSRFISHVNIQSQHKN